MKKFFSAAGKTLLGIVIILVVLFVALYLATTGEYPVPKTVVDDPSLPRVTIKGSLFHAETFGDPARPVLIVLHGGPGWDYRSLLPLKALADEYFVVFYDQRGTGLSPRVDPGETTLQSSLEDLDLFVDHFSRGRKVSLIGHSWGAMLASGYLGTHPDKVGHAVLAEPGFLTTEMMKTAGIRLGPLWEAGFLLRATMAWFRALHVKVPDDDARADYFMGQVAPYANPEYYCSGTVPEAGVLHWRVGTRAMQGVMRSALDREGNFQIDLTRGLERFTRPVLFLVSECNATIGREHQERQARFFPRAEIALIPGSGHMLFGERPAESISAVRVYLRTK